MANFWQAIIDKVTGHGNNPATAKIDIAQVATAAAAVADPKVQQAQEAAARAEAEKAAEAAAAAKGNYEPQSSAAVDEALKQIHEATLQAAQEVADAADQFEIIKEHKLTYDDTLSALALHFYGHATPEYWGLIILANKKEIGDKVSDFTPGKVIKIPKLPDSMKK